MIEEEEPEEKGGKPGEMHTPLAKLGGEHWGGPNVANSPLNP